MPKEKNRLKHFSSEFDFSRVISRRFPKLKLRKSAIQGRGVLADEDIKAGGIICPLLGFIYRDETEKINLVDFPKYSYQISDDADIETINEPAYFNHSCAPNIYINGDWLFEAIKDIANGEELRLDYGTVDYFSYRFKCSCGAEGCRKEFNGMLSADSRYQKKMGRYFSPYLKTKFNLEKIRRINPDPGVAGTKRPGKLIGGPTLQYKI
jgi:hypothetical protein